MTTESSRPAAPSALSLAFVPALITLGVTALRLGLELAGAPGWMASTEPGGAAALVGITWLPVIFGPFFAFRLRPYLGGKPFWLRLWKTLTVYGLLARVPVVLITVGALLGNWGTHYEKFGAVTGLGSQIAVALLAQLGLWACIWTPAAGLASALVALALRPRVAARHIATRA